jgi:hypothetical protein
MTTIESIEDFILKNERSEEKEKFTRIENKNGKFIEIGALCYASYPCKHNIHSNISGIVGFRNGYDIYNILKYNKLLFQNILNNINRAADVYNFKIKYHHPLFVQLN